MKQEGKPQAEPFRHLQTHRRSPFNKLWQKPSFPRRHKVKKVHIILC